MRVLGLVPGGQTLGNSPVELLMKEVARLSGWNIEIRNLGFEKLPLPMPSFDYDLIWGGMDGGSVPPLSVIIRNECRKRGHNPKLYIHGEWIPPYRVQEGWEEKYREFTRLDLKPYYIANMEAMKQADLVSLGLPEDAPGSFDWIEENFGYVYPNRFIRLPYVKRFYALPREPQYKVATIARATDGKKRVRETVDALSRIEPTPQFDIIGAEKGLIPLDWVNCLGIFNDDSKIAIYADSLLSVQHWAGIPPAEAIQQNCPVVSYICKEMVDMYGDALCWVEQGNILELANTIVNLINNPNFAQKQAEKALHLLNTNQLGISYVDVRAKEIIDKIKELLND